MTTKKWYLSKTLWVNAIGALAIFIQTQYGFVVPLEYQAGALAAINMVLRLITHEGLTT